MCKDMQFNVVVSVGFVRIATGSKEASWRHLKNEFLVVLRFYSVTLVPLLERVNEKEIVLHVNGGVHETSATRAD